MITLYLVFLHFVADFVLQDRETAKTKSTQFGSLFLHLCVQFCIFASGLLLVVDPFTTMKFAFYNTIIHGIIDWNIWKGYKALAHYRIMASMDNNLPPDRMREQYTYRVINWAWYDDYWFWTTVGFDQMLHMLTLVWLKETLL